MYGLYYPWLWDALCGTDEHWLKFRCLADSSEDKRLAEIQRSVTQLTLAEINSKENWNFILDEPHGMKFSFHFELLLPSNWGDMGN